MAPSEGRLAAAGRIVVRAAVLLAAGLLVAGAIYLLMGPPTPARLYRNDEIARFRPTAGHGIVQLLGETGLLALFVYLGRRWLRIRL